MVDQLSPIRIMCAGDSITAGVGGAATSPGYRKQLQTHLVATGYPIDFVGSEANGDQYDNQHEGHLGWAVSSLSDQIGRWLTIHQPDAVLLHIGTNDIIGGIGLGVSERLAKLLNRIEEITPARWVFVSTITPVVAPFPDAATYNALVTAYNLAIPSVVAGRPRAVAVAAGGTLVGADMSADGVHPSQTGYDKMGDAWYTALSPYLGLL